MSIIRRKKAQITPRELTEALREVLMRDFSEPFSSKMLNHNYKKNGLKFKCLNNGSCTKLINSIASDYKAIRPYKGIKIAQLKKDLHLAMR